MTAGDDSKTAPRPKAGRLKNVLINMGLVLASLVVVLIISEIFLTLYEEQIYLSAFIDPYLPERDDSVMCVDLDDPTRFERFAWDEDGNNVIHIRSSNPKLVYELRPSSWVSTHIQTNAAGFRDYEFTLEKPANVYRICVVGDSVTFGWLLKQDELYPKALEALLKQEERPERRFQVYNMGVDGYNAEQELELIKTRVLPFTPGLIVIGFCANDDTVGADAGLWRHFSRGRLRTIDFLKLRWMQLSESYRGEGLLQRSYRAIGGLSRDRQIPVLVVIFPHLDDQYQHTERQIEFCQQFGLMWLDLTPPFKEAGIERILHDGVHPTAEGHEIAAEAIYRYLKENVL